MTTMTINKTEPAGLPRAEQLVTRYKMLPPGETVLVAVSGGADSMSLLHFLWQKSRAGGCSVTAAHFHHGLRGADADRDEQFVKDWCIAREIPFVCEHGDVRAAAEQSGETIEEAARRLRYDFLERTADRLGAVRIAVAHQAEDNAETMLMQLVRGAGLRGLSGIPPVRGRIVRPLLTTPKVEIVTYCKTATVPYVEDATNTSRAMTRNRFRLDILPLLQQENPNLTAALGRQAERFRREDAYLDALADVALSGVEPTACGVTVPCRVLNRADAVLRPRMVRQLIDRLPVGKKDFDAGHFEAVVRLTRQAGAKQISLPHGVCAAVRAGRLGIWQTPPTPVETVLQPGVPVRFGDWSLTLDPVKPSDADMQLDATAAAEPLRVTCWRRDDRMTLPGYRGSRSLKRLFADAGILPAERERYPVLRCGNTVAAVPHIGTEEAFIPRTGVVRRVNIKRRSVGDAEK